MSIKDYFKKTTINLVEEIDSSEGGVVTQREKEEVVKQLKTADLKGKRGEYLKLTIEEKREIGDYAKTNGVPATVRKYKTRYPTLSRNTVSDYRRYARDKVVLKSRGRPTLLPEEIMQKTIDVITALRLKGAPVSTSSTVSTLYTILSVS